MGYYIRNMETGKLELHFEKEEYMALSEDIKSTIKSNFLFSRKSGAWVSRCKFPNLYRPERVAKELGLENKGKEGDKLSFEERMERKAERAEHRAERYDEKSNSAVKNGEALQSGINSMHGDIAFFTQPITNNAAGRAFGRRREKMWDAYMRGYDEFKKSEYYKERAEIARQTASSAIEPTDKGFCLRRIKEAEKAIRAQKKNLEHYADLKKRIENGETIKRVYNNEILTLEEVENWIEHAEEVIEDSLSKAIYYHEAIDKLGGINFSKGNIKPGCLVKMKRWGKCKVISAGTVNITFEIMEGGASGSHLTESYADILEVISSEIEEVKLPFEVGDIMTFQVWDGNNYVSKGYKVTKVANGKVTVKSGTERAITKAPRYFADSQGNKTFVFSVPHCREGFYKKAEA